MVEMLSTEPSLPYPIIAYNEIVVKQSLSLCISTITIRKQE